MKRRDFIKQGTLGAAALAGFPLTAHAVQVKDLKISLAQWSLHRSFGDGTLDPVDFAAIAAERYGINALEYVNGFYLDRAGDKAFWNNMKDRSDAAGAKNLLMMVDDEGDLGAAGEMERLQAVENHYKWLHAARTLGCHSIRVNAFGDRDREVFRIALADALARLSDYAAELSMNIIVENHGLFSSDAALIAKIIGEVNRPNLGSFPDFGNWCLSAKWGSTQGACDRMYDPYQGVSELMPHAKAVSAKSYNFNEKGEDRKIDYYRMMRIVKQSSYTGHIGIEYEGTEKSEHEGILLTMELMKKAWNNA